MDEEQRPGVVTRRRYTVTCHVRVGVAGCEQAYVVSLHDRRSPVADRELCRRSFTGGSRWEAEASGYTQGFQDGYSKALRDFCVGQYEEEV